MSKKLIFNENARKKILDGIKIVFDAVSTTLGPKGNNVAIERDWGTPLVIHDGVGVAREIDLEDQFENVGVQLIKDAAERTNKIGDGTTLTTILTYEITKECFKNIAAGANPMMIRKGIEKAVKVLINTFDQVAQKINNKNDILKVAKIASQSESIGNIVNAAFEKIGKDGIITVEESDIVDLDIDFREGMEFDKGFLNPNFITDLESGEAIVKNPYILVIDQAINNMQEFVPFIDNLFKQKINRIVIICEQMSADPLSFLIINKVKGNLNVSVIQSPGAGDRKKDYLEDIACLCGSQFISKESGITLESITLDDLGQADQIVSSKENTIIVGGKGNKSEINFRIEYLKKQIEKLELSEYDREKLQERLAKLTSGIAVINVGANSEAEIKEKKERVIDAISAVRAALEEGIVPGGEVIFISQSGILDEIKGEKEELIGVDIIRKAIIKPFFKLMENSGFNAGEQLAYVKEMTKKKEPFGVDVLDGKIKNMIEVGIIDPVKIVKAALKNAASAAIMLMTTSVVITTKKDKKNGQSQQNQPIFNR